MGRCRVKRQRPILCGKKVKSEWRKSKFAVGDLFHQLLDGFQAGSLSTGAHYAGGAGGSGKAQRFFQRQAALFGNSQGGDDGIPGTNGILDGNTQAGHKDGLLRQNMQHTAAAHRDDDLLHAGLQQLTGGGGQLLLAVQPTRGLDVGAIEYIHSQLVKERDEGRAILLISLELDEVMNLADRILVMYEGEIVAELDPKSTTIQELGLYMAGSKRGAEYEKAITE